MVLPFCGATFFPHSLIYEQSPQAKTGIPAKELEITEAEAGCKEAAAVHEAALNTQEKAEAQHHAVSMGMAADEDGNTKTFAEQQKDVRTALTALDTEKAQAKMRVDHIKPDLKVRLSLYPHAHTCTPARSESAVGCGD